MALTERQEIAIRVALPSVPSSFEHTPAAGKPPPPDAAFVFTANAGTDLLTATAHGLVADVAVRFESDTTLPAGLSAGTTYYVIASGLTADAFKISATVGGAAIDITDAGTGSHTWSRYLTTDERAKVDSFLAFVTNGSGPPPAAAAAPAAAAMIDLYGAYHQSSAYKTWWHDDQQSRAAQYRLRQADTIVANDATVPISGDPGGGGSDPPASPIERYEP